jgi:uncharacterized membrane protein HdeD (DUF308 family)
VLVLIFGAYVPVDGSFAVVSGVTNRGARAEWWLLVLEGLAGIAVGILTLVWPQLTELVLLYLIGIWAVMTGALEIIVAVRLRRELQGEWLLIFTGLLSAAFGVIVMLSPDAGTLAIVWLIGVFAIIFGVMLVALGLRLSSWWRSASADGGRA